MTTDGAQMKGFVGMAGLKRPAAGFPLHPGDHGDPRHRGCPPGQVLGIQVYDLVTQDITWITKSALLVSKFLHQAGHQVAGLVVGMAGLKRPVAGFPLHPGDHGDPRHHEMLLVYTK